MELFMIIHSWLSLPYSLLTCACHRLVVNVPAVSMRVWVRCFAHYLVCACEIIYFWAHKWIKVMFFRKFLARITSRCWMCHFPSMRHCKDHIKYCFLGYPGRSRPDILPNLMPINESDSECSFNLSLQSAATLPANSEDQQYRSLSLADHVDQFAPTLPLESSSTNGAIEPVTR